MSKSSLKPVEPGEPLANFSQCHEGILERLRAVAELPQLLGFAQRAKQISQGILPFFKEAVFEHHLDEERELFPAVLASSLAGEERDEVQFIVAKLTREHRAIEAIWNILEPQLKKFSQDALTDVDAALLVDLVQKYEDHAQYEESIFLPMSERILARNGDHMAALGLALHMRRQPIQLGWF